MQRYARAGAIAVLILGLASAEATETRELRLPDKIDLSIEVEPAPGDTILLWLPSGIPAASNDADLARRIGALGIEVWRPDLLGARFLPNLESSLEQIPDSDVAVLLEAARVSGRHVALLASARAGVLALRAARHWQTRHPHDATLMGAILLHPALYLGPPEPGREAEFHPVVSATHMPLVVIQPEKSPWHFRLEALRNALQRAGAAITVRELAGVRDRYYFRPDATPQEDAEATRLPDLVRESLGFLRVNQKRVALAAAPAKSEEGRKTVQASVRGLHLFQGDPVAPALALTSLDGHAHNLADYRGRVVLINFWASWCPPCVREMPSMQRLSQKLAEKPFTILAVNMAEPQPEVRAFLARFHLGFPVLLDQDGAALKQWKVFVFPTSYVIDAEGRIRFGVYGEVEWDAPETLGIIQGLLPAATVPDRSTGHAGQ
jgi:thiol-disulfide isomerase/thioredoxin